MAKPTKTFAQQLAENAVRFRMIALNLGRVVDPLPGPSFPSYAEADAALRRARQASPSARYYLTNEGGLWRLRDAQRLNQFDHVAIVPGTLPGSHRPSGMAASHMVFTGYKNFDKWPKADQDGQIFRFYSGSVGAGIVWC